LRSAILFGIVLSVCISSLGQAPPPRPARKEAPHSAPSVPEAKKKFVLDVVKNAVALPEPDQQDRLRVLYSAASVVSPLDSRLARQFGREGVRIESEMIATGQKPPVSMFSAGQVDCATAGRFVEQVPAPAVAKAEESIIAAVSSCSNTAVDPARSKLEAALSQRVVAPRALMAVIDHVGAAAAWSQAQFRTLFSSLPDGAEAAKDAPNYAAMFAQMAKSVNQDTARESGLKLLLWLGKLPSSGERTIALQVATSGLQEALGQEKYQDALRSDIMAKQAADAAQERGEITPPEEESVSVLRAMDQRGADRSEELSKMKPSLRAREAAASGFAAGTGGDHKQAQRYFDVAFDAADEVWSKRSDNPHAAEVVEEVSQAAAQVDPVNALVRAQKMQDPSSQAIGMLAVARVVAASQ
jgi:hypothetical protein